MDYLLDQLPGIRLPVEDVTRTLRDMWEVGADEKGRKAPADFRASQMNLILHFGLKTPAAEAIEGFETAIRFAQRYPCRIIVLCPARPNSIGDLLEAKLFSQCYIGANQRDVCCCEALILGYSIEESGFLENQVSLWVEADLPVYHWFNRVPARRIKEYYFPFIQRCTRILIDSANAGSGFAGLDWPEPRRVRDLAQARTLPFRQQLGQFFSSIPVEVLLAQVAEAGFAGEKLFTPELIHLRDWHHGCWRLAGENFHKAEPPAAIGDAPLKRLKAGEGMQMKWMNKKGETVFQWSFQPEARIGLIRCRLKEFGREHVFHLEPLKSEAALAEALFF